MARLRLSAAAEADIVGILTWSEDRFGDAARRRYEVLLAAALRDLAVDPERVGSAARPEIGPDVRSYHLFHSRERARTEGEIVHRPRHFILYRVMTPGVIGIGRVLHDAMDIDRHLPSEYGDE